MALQIESKYKIEVPPTDLTSFIFSSNDERSDDRPQYFDADQPQRHFSLKEAKSLVKRLAKGLQDLGLKPNDKVLLYSGNSLYFPILFWGTIAAGCVFTGCSPGASLTELTYQLKDSEARVLIASPEGIETAVQATSELGISKSRVFTLDDPNEENHSRSLPSWTSIWANEEETRSWNWKAFSTTEEAQETTAVLNYSSGTTGRPKGVEISHYNIISNSLQVIFKRKMVGESDVAKQRRDRITLSEERWLAPLPMFHAFGQMYFCVTAARTGAKLFIMSHYTIQRYLLFLDIYRITFLTGVPTLLVALTKYPGVKAYNLKAVETVVTGSAPLNPEIGLIVQTHLRAGVQVKQGYGLTETTCSVTGFAPDEEDDGRSIGWLNPNLSAKIVPSPEWNSYKDDIGFTVGEIWIAGPNIMKGYYKRPDDTANVIVHEDGKRWLRTGDVGYADSRGCFYIVDRLKELIKVKGLQVAPAEIEQILLSHPGIEDSAVVGEKRPDGEYPKAFVVRTADSHLTAEDVQRFTTSRLSKHKWLTAGVYFLDKIPRTSSGKVMRRLLQKSCSSDTDRSAKL